MTADDNAAIARSIIDSANYVTLATADAGGRPWATPVFFAPVGYRELLWVSRPGAEHSRNLAQRPELSAVVFDSAAAPSTGQAVYMQGTAAPVADGELDAAVAAFDSRLRARDAGEWSRDDVTPPAELRFYRARIESHHILDPDATTDTRIAVEP